MRRKPYSVVLLDEIEKAHPDVFNVLLQVLDDGRLTDSHGRTVDFKNTLLILTSNLGSEFIAEGHGVVTDDIRDKVMELLRRSFRPEFLNRLDEIVTFKPLRREEVRRIVRLLLKDLVDRVHGRGLELDVTDAAVDLLVDRGYDPVFGARPLKREIQRDLETEIAKTIIAGDFRDGDTVRVDAKKGAFAIGLVPRKST